MRAVVPAQDPHPVHGFTEIADAFRPGAAVAPVTARRDLDPAAHAAHAMARVDACAAILGGCCEIGLAHITELARRLSGTGRSITWELE